MTNDPQRRQLAYDLIDAGQLTGQARKDMFAACKRGDYDNHPLAAKSFDFADAQMAVRTPTNTHGGIWQNAPTEPLLHLVKD